MANYTLSVGTPIWAIEDSLAVRSGKFTLELIDTNDEGALWNLACKATGKVRAIRVKDGHIAYLGDWL